ncbi:MAG TPA: hydroxymethylbilane synthase [Solirubrobacterales bacterium]|jgi:hydroxymethylbilane synthase|nr:hydroxymethylbilane synthase [Solirubrobacterales bacterium]
MIRLATRSSALAKAQASQVAELLGGAELVEVSSDGEPGDKARFVRGVERALLDGGAEIGVHSAKDVPAEMPEGLTIAAVPAREDPADVWIGAGASLEEVPEGARVGTASLRRRAQLLAARPDLQVSELHGNVDTRLRRLAEGELDAIVLAAAGLRRLDQEGEASFALPAEAMTPAAGQGALVLQTRASDAESTAAAATIGDETALRELTAERAVVALLEADCTTPIGVHAGVAAPTLGQPRTRRNAGDAVPDGDVGNARPLVVEAFVGLPDGSEWIRDRVEGDAAEPAAAGALLAERLLGAGAREILDRAGNWSAHA